MNVATHIANDGIMYKVTEKLHLKTYLPLKS